MRHDLEFGGWMFSGAWMLVLGVYVRSFRFHKLRAGGGSLFVGNRFVSILHRPTSQHEQDGYDDHATREKQFV